MMLQAEGEQQGTVTTVHVLNLGAGVQSTTLYLMFMAGLVKDPAGNPLVLDYAITADTGDSLLA
jgi:hypothetical protein